MTPTTVIALARHALEIALMISAPMFIAALATGLIISIFQAATQINESTLSFIPKLLAIVLALLLTGPWVLAILTDYIRDLFESIPTLIG